jgi:NAD+ kinase
MKTIGIFPYLKKPRATEVSLELANLLKKSGFEVVMEDKIAKQLGQEEWGLDKEGLLSSIDLGIVLGGDGALLYLARLLYPREIPIFGINLGRLGFLTEVEDKDLNFAVEKLKQGDFLMENRIMVGAEVVRRGKPVGSLVGLNDIVINKGASSRMLRLEILIDRYLTATMPADGLIISTPTGSTAYSLSAGGSILDPQLSALILTPICAHSFFTRPLVVGSKSIIEVKFTELANEAILTADGQEGIRLEADDVIRIFTAPHFTKFVRFKEKSFYNILREKIKQGRL